MVVTSGGQEYYMDGFLQSNMDRAKAAVKDDWDMCFVVDGTERGGKSRLAAQLAKYCDPDYSLDNCAFNANQFMAIIKRVKQFSAVVFDESFGGLNSRSSLSYTNKAIVQMMTEIGQKNLFVFIVLPSFFDLDRYVALWRSRALIHVYCSKDFKRGFFKFYNAEKKKYLYLVGQKIYSYARPSPNFFGRFSNHSVYDDAAYRKKKIESTLGNSKVQSEFQMRLKWRQQLVDRLKEHGHDLSEKAKAEIIGVSLDKWYKLKRNEDAEEAVDGGSR